VIIHTIIEWFKKERNYLLILKLNLKR